MQHHDATKQIQSILDEQGASARVEGVIRIVGGRHVVAHGQFDDAEAVFKLALSPKVYDQLADTDAELARITPHMSALYQVNHCLAYFSESGLIVLEKAAGEPVLPMLSTPEGADLWQHLPNWLHRYSSPSIEWRKAGPGFWIKQAAKVAEKQPHDVLRQREKRLLVQMRDLAENIAGREWRVAISHGDYHPNNLLWDGAVMTGIDVGGSSYMPIYKDIARCLIHLGRRRVYSSPTQKGGLDAPLMDSFSQAFDLSNQERRVFLPFFLAFECLIKVEQPDAPAWRISAAADLYDDILTTL